ncbi:PAS domain S-box protein [Algoriphagus chordae]|uniref:histidine kinase n=1 Tax=Algoriphagus chordae TaxID=237019 RepID=A0A2W7QMN0_9BACT|nr:PAS domain S-box protein [Algoriphagus chordae]PZX49604.1 PAS domain S-box-containing protein [Algoriphagus chordae]
MSKNSDKGESKSDHLSVHSYQNLDPVQDASLYRICQLGSIICSTPKAIFLFEDASKVGFTAEVGDNEASPELYAFFKNQTSGSSEIVSCEDIATLSLDAKIAKDFSDSSIKSFVGIPLQAENKEWVGCLVVLGDQSISLDEKSRTALRLLASEALIIIEERTMLNEFSNVEKLFNLSNDLICIAGVDGFFKKVNPSFTRLLGWSKEKLLSTSFFELVHPDDLEKTGLEIKRLSEGESTINFSHRFKCEDGTYKILEWVASPEIVTGNLYAIARDITEASQRELELEQSEKRQRVFFQNSPGFMCTHDMQGKLLAVNKAGAEMLGYTESEIIGMNLLELVPEYRQEAVGIYLKTIEKEGKLSNQMVTQHKNGETYIWMFNNVLERSSEDGALYVIGNAIDITARVKLEEDLRQTKLLLEETGKVARVGGWNLDLELQQVTWTPMTKQIHELPPEYEPDLATGINFYKEGESRDKIIEALDSTILEGKSWDLELQLVTHLGNEIWVRSIGQGEMVNGVCKRIFGTFQDIDETKKARLELERTKKLAEEASVAKSEFLANMSHEIRTPLNGVIGFTDLVLKTNLNETQHQYLSIVNQSANALLSIINDILDFSKIEAGRLELDIDKCDLYEMSSQATDIITYQIQSKGLEMLLNLATDLPRFVYADSVRLKQILVNLLGNASKFTEKGEIELKIQTLEKNGDLHKIRFAVRDTGIGIKPEKQSKIFEAFSQEDSSTTKKYGGTGLGLTISNSLLRLMDSQLHLTSVPGEGSTFYFEVTLKTEDGEPIDWFDVDEIKNVLIVDDNENNRLIVRQMLLLKNINSVEASNGFEALQILSTGESFDVILMDYHMPFMDGLETIRKIRETFPSWEKTEPIMLLHSSSDDHKIIESCRELRVNHRLIKPLKIQDFYQALSRLYTFDSFKEIQEVPVHQSSARLFTVLVAEDNPVNMLLAKTIIKKIAPKATLVEVSNGLEALEYCKKQFPDIILMDVQMPVMNGYEATRSIRVLEKDTHVPIIAFTAGNVKGEREKCLASGMDDFVVKPVVEETIEMVFNKWLDSDYEFGDAARDSGGTAINPHYNAAKLKNYTDNDPEVLKGILTIVKSELKSSLDSLKKFIASQDLTKINEAGHKLFGTAISSGMRDLSKMAVVLEQMEDIEPSELKGLLDALEKEIEVVLKLIDKENIGIAE